MFPASPRGPRLCTAGAARYLAAALGYGGGVRGAARFREPFTRYARPMTRIARHLLPLLAIAALAAGARPAAAQVTPADSARPLTAPAAGPRRDTARVQQPDTTQRRYRISPRGAFLRSLVIPGWGQSEIGAPERGIVYFALESGSLWMTLKSHRRLGQALEQQRILRETGAIEEDATIGLVRSRRNQREDWITLSLFWLFFSGADAYVAANLRDFDAQVGVTPGPGGAVRVQGSVPVGPRR